MCGDQTRTSVACWAGTARPFSVLSRLCGSFFAGNRQCRQMFFVSHPKFFPKLLVNQELESCSDIGLSALRTQTVPALRVEQASLLEHAQRTAILERVQRRAFPICRNTIFRRKLAELDVESVSRLTLVSRQASAETE